MPAARSRRMRPAGGSTVSKAWLWAFAGENVTVYLIAPGRGYEHACEILGEDYSGVLERDGWAPYRRFTNAKHQTCACASAAADRRADRRLGRGAGARPARRPADPQGRARACATSATRT